MRRRSDAEEIESGAGHILDPGVLGENGAIAEKHTGNEVRIDAVIAAPGFEIVAENAGRDFAHGGIPTGAVAVGIADDEIGRGVEIGARVKGLGRPGLCGWRRDRGRHRGDRRVWRRFRA